MIRYYVYVLCTFLFLSCQNKKMELPQVKDVEITQVDNFSQVHIFYEEATGEAKLNANELISSTNWVFHIDRRNNLEKVAKHFSELQEKKKNPRNPHSNPDAHVYFSLADIPHKQLGFIDVTNLTFLTYDPKEELKYGNTPIFVYPDGFRLKENGGEKTPWDKFGTYKNVYYIYIFSGKMTFQQFIDIYWTELHQNDGGIISRIYVLNEK